MRLGSLEFSPGRWPTLITMALLGILLSLGFWQLDRAEQKRELLAAYQRAQDSTVVQLEADTTSLTGLQYQFAAVTGRYDADHQFLLDNRTYQGRVGYHVLTPFKLRDSDVGILVNRGWIPLGGSREVLPNPGADSRRQSLVGRVKQPSDKGFTLGEEEPRGGWPYRVQRAQIDRLAAELGYPLLPVMLLLEHDQPDGFVRDWNPLTFGPERNVGYAVQWFGLALALLVIYLLVNTRMLK